MNKLKEIINTVLFNAKKDPVNEITDSMDLYSDIGLSSLNLAELTVRIEAEYGIDIFEDGFVRKISEVKEKLKIQ